MTGPGRFTGSSDPIVQSKQWLVLNGVGCGIVATAMAMGTYCGWHDGRYMDLWSQKTNNSPLKVGERKAIQRWSEWGAEADGRSVAMLPSRRDWRRISLGEDHVTPTALHPWTRGLILRASSGYEGWEVDEDTVGSLIGEFNCVLGRHELAGGCTGSINTEALNQNRAVHH